jgi:hypothetical protein
MSRRNRSNGIDDHDDSGTPTARQSPGVSASAPVAPLYALDALRALLDMSWSAWSRLVAASEDLHRLQSVALDTAAAALTTAVSGAERARDVQDLFKVRSNGRTTVEQCAALQREWLDRLTALTSDLAARPWPWQPHGRQAVRRRRSAVRTARPSGRPTC